MLVEFRLENYKCFRDEAVFSLVAGRDDTLPGNTVELPVGKGLRLLKSAVIYGANASGKTTLLDALYFFVRFIRTSFKQDPGARTGVSPFLLDAASAGRPTSFEVAFVAEERVLYRYGFSLSHTAVLEEWLLSYPAGRPRQLFRRSTDDGDKPHFKFSGHLRGERDKLAELTRHNALFLSVGAALNHPQLLPVYRWLTGQVHGVQAHRLADERDIVRMLAQRRVEPVKVRELLRFADVGIADLVVAEHEITELDVHKAPEDVREVVRSMRDKLSKSEGKLVSVEFIHQAQGVQVSFDLGNESQGTLQLLALSEYLLPTLAEGGLIFVDELDASLHPLLVRALVGLFHNPQTNPNNAQLIFNTHDTSLLSSAIFRRDQIWLAEKAPDGAACIYPLLDYSPRKDEALEKGYLQGRYGAIPFLSEPAEGLLFHA